jgi:outer membrane usher protein
MPVAFQQLGLLGWASVCGLPQPALGQPAQPTCTPQWRLHGESSPFAIAATDLSSAMPPAGSGTTLQGATAAAQPAATEAQLAAAPQINLPALIGDRYLGDVGVSVVGDDASIDAERLLALLTPELTADVIEEIRAQAVGGRINPKTASTPNLTIKFNAQLLQLEISTPASARQLREIRYGYDTTAVDNIKASPGAGISAFISPNFAASYVWEDDALSPTGLETLGGSFLAGGRIGGDRGIAFQSRHSFAFRNGPGFTRDETFLVYDDLKRLIRVTAGDIVPRGSGFQSVPIMAGLTVERFFGLEPDRLIRPVGNSTFQLERPSTVEVRINGVTQRDLFLQPGRYNLRDLPLVQGSNLVELVIRDDTGQERVISDQNFYDFDLLAPGITDFSASIGVRSRFGTRAPIYSSKPVLTAFARRGISQSLTAGVDIQASEEGVNGGVAALWSAPVGVFQFDAAASQYKGYGSGIASALNYKLAGTLGSKGARFAFDLRGEYRSTNYATVNDRAPLIGPVLNQPTSVFLNARAQAFFGKFSINGSASYSKGRGIRRDTSSALLGANYTISPQLTVGGFARHINDGQRKDTGFVFQLFWRPGRDRDVRARYDTSNREAQLTYRKSAPRTVGSLSYSIDAIRNDDNDQMALSGDAFYTGNRFEANVRHDVSSDASFSSANRRQISRANIGTSLVFADGDFAIGRPVREAFAIIKPHPTLKGKTIRIDPTERGYVARTDTLGPAVNVDVSSYAKRSINYSVDDLPPGYDLGSGEFTIKPSFFGGYVFFVGSDASYSVLGRLNDREGKPIPFASGKFTPIGQADDTPLLTFTNRTGRLAATGLRPGKYLLTIDGQPSFSKEIIVTEGKETLVDIGIIEVDAP